MPERVEEQWQREAAVREALVEGFAYFWHRDHMVAAATTKAVVFSRITYITAKGLSLMGLPMLMDDESKQEMLASISTVLNS